MAEGGETSGELMEGGEEGAALDLMSGLGVDDEKREGMDLMGNFREEGGEALGDDVLGGGLFSPRQDDLMAGLGDAQQGDQNANELMGDAREDGEALGDDVLGGGLFSPRPGEGGEAAPDNDLMAGLGDGMDLMAGLGGDDEKREGMDLMGDFREEGGEALGDDVLGGGLFSPRQEDDGEAGVSAEASEEVSAELSVEASAEAVSGGLDESQQDEKDMEDAAKKIQTIHRGGRDRAKVPSPTLFGAVGSIGVVLWGQCCRG